MSDFEYKFGELYSFFGKLLKYDSNVQKFILDTQDPKYAELKNYFEFDDFSKASMILKVWISELIRNNIKDETSEDSLLLFFRIKYSFTNNKLLRQRKFFEE